MKNLSAKNWSILSLLLVSASAVTAAITPSKDKEARFSDGILKNGTAVGHVTCTLRTGGTACIAATGSTATPNGPETTNRNTSGVTTLE